jgi:hypothetical protein
MTLGPGSQGGAAVAQPARAATWLRYGGIGLYALITVGLALWTAKATLDAGGGRLGAPLDDSYIHFQFARTFAEFRPFEYSPGQPPVPGATSLLWPALLVPAFWASASTQTLIAITWFLGFAALFGQACEVFLASRRFLAWPFAYAAGLLVLSFSANTWFAASAMEVVPLGFVLLRCARRAAEYADGQRSVGRRRELLLLAFAAVLLRPEGALGAACVALGFALSGRAEWPRAVVASCAPLLLPSINRLFTGHAAQTTSLAKWLPFNPYYEDTLLSAISGNVQLFFGTLLDGRQWSWTFVPEGYGWLGALCLPGVWLAAERGRARAHGALLCLIGVGILLPTTYETFLVNRLRYLWPFSAPWLLGLAALGQLVATPLMRRDPRLLGLGMALPALSGYGFARLAHYSVADVAGSAAAISLQQVELGRWAAQNLPADAKIGVNDAGAIAFLSGRSTFDVVGLTTRGEARHWVAGAGSRFEHYERLPRGELPTHFIVYPEWFALRQLFGEWLTERRVEGATILGGVSMVAYTARYDLLGSGATPLLPIDRPLVDELDVADLESEAQHGYVLGQSSAQLNLVHSDGQCADGGRAQRSYEQLELELRPRGLLVVRIAADAPSRVGIWLAGTKLDEHVVDAGSFRELRSEIPPTVRGKTAIILRSNPPITLFHYWSYGTP